jgi:hypothetical protein
MKQLEQPVKPPQDDEQDMREGKMHVDDLMRAHEIMNNPEKMAKVHKVIGQHEQAVTAIKSIGDIKSRANDNAMKAKAKKQAPAAPTPDLDSLKGGM